MRTELVDAIEDAALKAAKLQLAIEEALPLTDREAVILTVGIRKGIKHSLALIAGAGQK